MSQPQKTEEEQWKLFACGPRCLLQHLELKGKPMSREDFLKTFKAKYPDWNQQCGLSGPARLLEIATELGIASKKTHLTDYDAVLKAHTAFVATLLVTRKDQNGNENNHCMLLKDINDKAFKIWTPNQDGNSQEGWLPRPQWAIMEVTAVGLN